ncbi:MAG TPA: hypothetical protein VMM81_03190 [Acidimicrobiia bacterium]|nr:hypothetical protein [Acidimicrobiia bacterium]
MSELGRELRRALETVAPPTDLRQITAHAPALPFGRVGRVLVSVAGVAALVGLTVVLLARDDDDQASVTTTSLQAPTTTLVSTPPAFITSPLRGEWHLTHPDTGELLVVVNDMIWDGAAFYILTRLGFGDHVIWRSTDGLEWARHRTIAEAGELGITGVFSGPTELISFNGRLIAAGNANGRATAWIDDGSSPWRSVDVGEGAVMSLVSHEGQLIAQVASPFDSAVPEVVNSKPSVWSSGDGEHWVRVAADEVFGETTWTSDLVTGPSGLLLLGFATDPEDFFSRLTGVFRSEDGTTWSRVEASGLEISALDPSLLTGGEFGYATVGHDSTVYASRDGIAWSSIGGVPESNLPQGTVAPLGLGLLEGRLVLVGGENFLPEGAEFNTARPGVWSYAGDGSWSEIELPWRDGPGIAYEVVVGGGVMVVLGEVQGREHWALLVFVADRGD